MSTLAGWNPSYFITASSGINENGGFGTSAQAPSGLGEYPAVFLTNRPEFNPNQEVLSSDKATSFPFVVQGDNDVERTLGTQSPEASYEFDLDVRSLYIPLVTLLQPSSGNVTTGSGTTKSFQAYSSGKDESVVDKFAYLLRRMDDTNNQEIRGCVANSINITGSEGEVMSCSVDFVGSSYDTTSDSPSGEWSTSDSFKMVSFDDITVKMGMASGTVNEIDVTSVDLSIGNNVVSKYYNNKTIQRYILGNLDISLSLSIPWSDPNVTANKLADWLGVQDDDDDVVEIHIYNGDSVDLSGSPSRGEFGIKMFGALDDTTSADGDEITNEVEITGLKYSSENPLQIELYDEVDRSGFSFPS